MEQHSEPSGTDVQNHGHGNRTLASGANKPLLTPVQGQTQDLPQRATLRKVELQVLFQSAVMFLSGWTRQQTCRVSFMTAFSTELKPVCTLLLPVSLRVRGMATDVRDYIRFRRGFGGCCVYLMNSARSPHSRLCCCQLSISHTSAVSDGNPDTVVAFRSSGSVSKNTLCAFGFGMEGRNCACSATFPFFLGLRMFL